MVADLEKALGYPFNFKPLFILGIIFVIVLIVFIIPLFLMDSNEEKEEAYLFNWNEIPGSDNERLIEYLKQDQGIEWAGSARIEKIDDNRVIRVFAETNSLTFRIDDQRTRVLLTINGGRTYEFIAKVENGNVAIYEKAEPKDKTAFLIIYSVFLLAAMISISMLLGGYLVSVSRNVLEGDFEKTPDITDIRKLFTDGLKFLVISGVYALVPFIILIPFTVTSIPLGLLLLFLMIPLFFVPYLGGAHFAYTNSMMKALDMGFIYSMVFHHIKEYSYNFFIFIIISIVLYIVSMLIVTYPFVMVANYIAGQYIFTIFYMESLGLKDNNPMR